MVWFTLRDGARAGASCCLMVLVLTSCSSRPEHIAVERPNVAPIDTAGVGEALELDTEDVEPMFTEMLAIDLPSVVRVAAAQNFDIRAAQQAVIASRGSVESAVGAAFPALVPTALFESAQGTVRATEGTLVGVGFNTFQPSIAIQWLINPGRVIYDIVAAKKRLSASEHEEEAVVIETLRAAVVQFYDIVLAQARISAAHQGVVESEELLRINRLRTQTGTGVLADELRAKARLAQRRQDLITEMSAFYEASVTLAVTLHLDSSVTLVPKLDRLPPIKLVRDDIEIEELLAIAMNFRPDLEGVKALVEAAAARTGSTWWGAFGPQFSASYQYGGITGNAQNAEPIVGVNGPELVDQTYSLSHQQLADASVEWRLSLSAFGNMKTAKAYESQAEIEALRLMDRVAAQVVTAAQVSRANAKLIGLARQQVDAAAEALRLSQANLEAGSMTTLDVLQAQDAVNQARVRHAAAVVRYNQAQVNLLASLGLLELETLAPSEVASTDNASD